MKKYAIEDLKTFERNTDGYLVCPSGDYNTFAQSIQKTRKKDTVMQCLAIEDANVNPYEPGDRI